MSLRKKNLLKNIFKYASSQYFAQFVGFFTAVFMRRFLGPLNMGIWNVLKVVADCATYTHLGTTNTVFYKIPFHRGRGEDKEADNIKNVVFSYLTITSFIAGIAICIYALIFREQLMPQIFVGLLAVSVMLLCRRIYAYYTMLLRANKDFSALSMSIAFDAIVNLGLIFLLVKTFQLNGFFLTIILMPTLNVWFIRRLVDYDIKFKFDLKRLGGYIKFGFPLFITSMLAMLLNNVDRVMIAKFIGLDSLGFYSLALMTKGYSVGLSRNFNVVITPHFLEDYGKDQSMETAAKYLKLSAELMSSFMALLFGMIFIVAPVFVQYVLPKFISGLNALNFLLIASFFYVASPQSGHFLVAMNRQTRLIPIISFVIVLNIALNFIFIKKGFGITGVAAATAISSFAAFFITLMYALKHVGRIKESIKFVALNLAPAVYAVIILFVIGKVVLFTNPFVSTGIKMFLFLICYSPWVYMVNKKTDVLGVLKTIIVEKIKRKRK